MLPRYRYRRLDDVDSSSNLYPLITLDLLSDAQESGESGIQAISQVAWLKQCLGDTPSVRGLAEE